MEVTDEEQDQYYILIRSASPALASASNKLSTWVSLKIKEGWSPHGSPVVNHDGDKFYLIQAMIKSSSDTN